MKITRTFEEILRTELHENDLIAQIIYKNCYMLRNGFPSWQDVQYKAPETQEGWAARNCQHTANEIRLKFLCTVIE
jgi:hypothetical protein